MHGMAFLFRLRTLRTRSAYAPPQPPAVDFPEGGAAIAVRNEEMNNLLSTVMNPDLLQRGH